MHENELYQGREDSVSEGEIILMTSCSEKRFALFSLDSAWMDRPWWIRVENEPSVIYWRSVRARPPSSRQAKEYIRRIKGTHVWSTTPLWELSVNLCSRISIICGARSRRIGIPQGLTEREMANQTRWRISNYNELNNPKEAQNWKKLVPQGH